MSGLSGGIDMSGVRCVSYVSYVSYVSGVAQVCVRRYGAGPQGWSWRGTGQGGTTFRIRKGWA